MTYKEAIKLLKAMGMEEYALIEERKYSIIVAIDSCYEEEERVHQIIDIFEDKCEKYIIDDEYVKCRFKDFFISFGPPNWDE